MDAFLESYKIDSPEHVEVEFSLAGLGSRTVAYVLDALVRIVVALILLLILSLAGLGNSLLHLSEVLTAILVIFIFVLQWAYFVVFEMALNGQTPGKKWMRIRVVRDGGYSLTFFSSVIRNLLRVVDFLPAFYGLGVFLIFASSRKKRLGDYLAGTIVIHQQRTQLLLPPAPSGMEKALPARRFPLIRLTDEETQVIRAFLERAPSLEREDRVRVREKIYQKMVQKIRQVYREYQEEPPHLRETLLQELVREE